MSEAGSPEGSPALELALAGGTVELWVAEPARTPVSLERARSLLPPAELERCERVIDPSGAGGCCSPGRRCGRSSRGASRSPRARCRSRATAAGDRSCGWQGCATWSPGPAGAEELSLSFSHSGSWVAVALGRGVSVGVDIEPRDRRSPPA